ncbi:MAG: hypothetical protein ACXU8N_03455 [Telluria sp.]
MDEDLFPGYPISVALALALLVLIMLVLVRVALVLGKPARLRMPAGHEPHHLLH